MLHKVKCSNLVEETKYKHVNYHLSESMYFFSPYSFALPHHFHFCCCSQFVDAGGEMEDASSSPNSCGDTIEVPDDCGDGRCTMMRFSVRASRRYFGPVEPDADPVSTLLLLLLLFVLLFVSTKELCRELSPLFGAMAVDVDATRLVGADCLYEALSPFEVESFPVEAIRSVVVVGGGRRAEVRVGATAATFEYRESCPEEDGLLLITVMLRRGCERRVPGAG